jgi:diguanylate cyclase (GGDEF)-like protein
MMLAPSLTTNEAERLAVLSSNDVLGTSCEATLSNIVHLAAKLTGSAISLVCRVDGQRQAFKARAGMQVTETPCEQAFSAYATLRPGELMVVPDARLDSRFRDDRPARGPADIRFYAGAPLISPEGAALGTLCIIDHEPRDFSEDQREDLQLLAAMVMTVLEQRRTMNRIHRLALLDPLTNLPDRTALFGAIESAICRQKRIGKPFSLLYVDLDGFKQINDLHGHAIGDEVLREVALALTATLRRGDVVGRLGGDEFALVLAGGKAEATSAAERVRQEVEARMRANCWAVTASIGTASFANPPDNADAALTAADKLMYVAKAARHHRIRYQRGRRAPATFDWKRLWSFGSVRRDLIAHPA